MKKCLAGFLGALLLLLGGCTLPAEERAFAVVLGVSENAGVWETMVRIPNYQQGGGYLTLSAQGNSFGEAMALLHAAAPMNMHLGQLRLLVVNQGLARSANLMRLVEQLCRGMEVRRQCGVCVTEDALGDVMDALVPMTGSRLSKSLETQLEALEHMGVIPAVTLGELRLMGERQQGVLMRLGLEGTTSTVQPGMDAQAGGMAAVGGSKVQLAGGCLLGVDGTMQGAITAGEQQLLSLLQGRMKQGVLALGDAVVTVQDASAGVHLKDGKARVKVNIRYTSASQTAEGVEQCMQEEIHRLMTTLTRAGCDALGLGRDAMRQCASWADWRNINWPEQYASLTWEIHVKAEGLASSKTERTIVRSVYDGTMSSSAQTCERRWRFQAALAGEVEGSTLAGMPVTGSRYRA